MTTTAPAHSLGTSDRLLRIVRLHFANPATLLYTPLGILAAIFLGSLAIFWVVLRTIGVDSAGGESGVQVSGPGAFIFIYMLVVAIQAVNITFGLALGYGSTRRDFYWGSALTFVLLSAAWTLLYTVMAAIESATNGWGMGGILFRVVGFGGISWVERAFGVFVLFLFFFFVGAATASVYVRWRGVGMTVFWIGLAALAVAAVALISLTDSWDSVWLALEAVGTTGGFALLLVPTAIAALSGWLILRRATPRG
ncbi:ABC transporter permease [Rathayibacter caricis DSM 15933]|jgi:hypothetical protein|uniref:ABC transporter permease n=1 Tax=Rathayibacter caricis DSM 15933 TaxID=1328867 RepID=A0A2T4UUJ5_9MICO|nr:ABC transporter permease [Rathayibacter caricis]MCJ1695206.1 ABC transporter permease [Rathayibacter caricis]PTL73196.1 ABC transporter permease [Rathayibacter caricis DSM 15933]